MRDRSACPREPIRKAYNIMGRSTEDALTKLMIKVLPKSHGTNEQSFAYIDTFMLNVEQICHKHEQRVVARATVGEDEKKEHDFILDLVV
jgi:hypothetical protein